jgi:hypothetical protein
LALERLRVEVHADKTPNRAADDRKVPPAPSEPGKKQRSFSLLFADDAR